MPIRIMLVEDHASFRQTLAFMFDREPEFSVVEQAGSLEQARATLRNGASEADVAVVDLGLPDGEGIDLIREMSDRNLSTLVLSASIDPAQIARAVEAGADGVLHKSCAIRDIMEAVRSLRNGEPLLSPYEVIEMLRMVGRKRREESEAQRSFDSLTPRELEVLRALAQGLDSKEIAHRLTITVETERTHMVNILKKLNVNSRLQALVFAVRHGAVQIH